MPTRPGSDTAQGVMGVRVCERRRRCRQVPCLRAQPGCASRLQAPGEARAARLVARVGWDAGAAQMTHQARDGEHTALLAAERGLAQPGPLGRLGAIAGHPHIQVQVHPGAVPGCHGRAHDRAEVPQAGHREVDSRRERQPEVGIHGVEPAQYGRRQPGLPQGQGFGDAGHPQPRRPVGQRRAGRLGAAVPETIGFDHGHHLTAGAGGEEPGIGRDRVQVHAEHGPLRAIGLRITHTRDNEAQMSWPRRQTVTATSQKLVRRYFST